MNSTIGTRKTKSEGPQFLKPLLIGVTIVVLLLIGAMAYIWFSGGSGEASGETTAPALVLQPGDTRTMLHIVPAESEVRFSIDEVLLENPKTVVGKTREVAGDVLVDFETPKNSQMGTIRINVRTLETDNEFRNRALRGQILQAEQAEFEFAEFAPTQLIGLPDIVVIGEPFTFQIQGRLTVHGVTREVTFDASITPVNESEITGTAQTMVLYRDFGMTIPEAPGVANVSDDVKLEIDFTAKASRSAS
jgi:polyisoprenoid-binding protein YceI